MKSAYELAIERLAKEAPLVELTEEQKEAIAEIENKTQAKIAEREVFLQSLITQAQATGNVSEAQELETQLRRETTRLRESGETQKEQIRNPRNPG